MVKLGSIGKLSNKETSIKVKSIVDRSCCMVLWEINVNISGSNLAKNIGKQKGKGNIKLNLNGKFLDKATSLPLGNPKGAPITKFKIQITLDSNSDLPIANNVDHVKGTPYAQKLLLLESERN